MADRLIRENWHKIKGARRLRAAKRANPALIASAARRGAGGGAMAGFVESLESRTLLSSTWFVAPWGSNRNPGTQAAPFQTIQQAANVANAGDHVEIRAGTYHETVLPAHSGTAGAPIVYEAYNGENVTISGADPIGGWSGSNGSTYKASMPVDLGEGNNQLFVDGRMINEARWPNTSLDPSHPTLATAGSATHSGDTATIYDSSLTQPTNYWNGAIIHFAPGQAWTAQTGTITSSGRGYVTFSYLSMDKYEQPTAGNQYYITGTYKALDAAGEWYRDPSSGIVYAQMPASDSPANHDVEAKHRQFAFDLSGQHDITLQNLNIFAATINTDTSSYRTVINHITARYLSQFIALPHGWDVPARTGIDVNGAYSVVENSSIAYSSGDGILVYGPDSRITNNVVHDVDYNGGDNAAIRVMASGVEVDHNSIYNAGRSGILHEASGLKILYNTVHDIGLQTTEAGGIYTVHTNGGGTEIAYNKIYNLHSGGYGATALFLDNNSSNYVVDNNEVWNVDTALKLNYTCNNDNIYNNTLSGTQYAVFTNLQGNWDGTTLSNNVFLAKAVFNSGSSAWNNVTSASVAGRGAGSFNAGTGAAVAADPGPPIVSTPASSGSYSGGGSSSSSGTSSRPPVTPPGSSHTPTPPSQSSGSSSSGTSSTPAAGGSGAGSPSASGPYPLMGPFQIPVDLMPKAPDWAAWVSADRSAIKAAVQQRGKQFKTWSAAIRADALAWRTAQQQLLAAGNAGRSIRTAASTTDAGSLLARVNGLRQAMQANAAAIDAGHRADFTGIKAAKKRLAADLKLWKAARRKGK
ncbi:MAG TPA: right-handed parallel beta-helix repeat-containing protein [Tepidisphaeraceae bacterium]|nr:right-handed parallel beta-helix repeat-containing protein [Tepidisphaeraceae bacterium]